MIEWFDPAKKLPEDGQECLLMSHEPAGLTTANVMGPICWQAQTKCWLDMWATPEAGTIISPDQVGCWTLWEPIMPPDDLPTPWPEK